MKPTDTSSLVAYFATLYFDLSLTLRERDPTTLTNAQNKVSAYEGNLIATRKCGEKQE